MGDKKVDSKQIQESCINLKTFLGNRMREKGYTREDLSKNTGIKKKRVEECLTEFGDRHFTVREFLTVCQELGITEINNSMFEKQNDTPEQSNYLQEPITYGDLIKQFKWVTDNMVVVPVPVHVNPYYGLGNDGTYSARDYTSIKDANGVSLENNDINRTIQTIVSDYEFSRFLNEWYDEYRKLKIAYIADDSDEETKQNATLAYEKWFKDAISAGNRPIQTTSYADRWDKDVRYCIPDDIKALLKSKKTDQSE